MEEFIYTLRASVAAAFAVELLKPELAGVWV